MASSSTSPLLTNLMNLNLSEVTEKVIAEYIWSVSFVSWFLCSRSVHIVVLSFMVSKLYVSTSHVVTGSVDLAWTFVVKQGYVISSLSFEI